MGPEVIMVTKQFYEMRWIVIALNFLLVTTLLSMGIGMVLEGLEAALKREIRTRVALVEEHGATFIIYLPLVADAATGGSDTGTATFVVAEPVAPRPFRARRTNSSK